MGRRNITIKANQLRDLYLRKEFTAAQIANVLQCTDVTVLNKLHYYGIKVNRPGRRNFKYKKFPFDGNLLEKSYMMGFRMGDLNVYRPKNKLSRIFVVRCHTTSKDQLGVFQKIFFRYGHSTVSVSPDNSYHVNCYLDHSFIFLLDKSKIPQWIGEAPNLGWSFMAGYCDAEGSFGIDQGRGRFKIDSYDYFILRWIKKFLDKNQIKSKFRCIYKQGSLRKDGTLWNNNLWRLNINTALSLETFVRSILPFSLHKKRVKDANKVLRNIKVRRENGTI
ncbi:LAGLIDADG family homing endonuclease [Candidatus Wolfebacteria bacterium]|nr:LAGLIDADG family homing endonuclease [Candidatus Wolfebacteria bacterium]